jgi:hypothetical protein
VFARRIKNYFAAFRACFAAIDRDFEWMRFEQNWKGDVNAPILVSSITVGAKHD